LKNIYGPVNSRRLGYSLGISIVPQKTCSFDCIYCELGANSKKYNKPDYYITEKEILSELKTFFSNYKGQIDYLTITGYGEPTLNKNLPIIAKSVKENYPQYKMALLTNSSFLDHDYVIESYKYFDIIMPSLDAASERCFNLIDKPDPKFTAKMMVENLKILRKNFDGTIELEILFCDGINTDLNEINLLYKETKEIEPDKVWINTVVRGPAYQNAKPISDSLKNNLAIFFNSATKKDKTKKDVLKLEDLIEKIKTTPLDIETLEYYSKYSKKDLENIFDEYEKNGVIEKKQIFGKIFFLPKIK